MGTLKMSAEAFVLVLAVNFFMSSGQRAMDQISEANTLSAILNKLQEMQQNDLEMKNKLQLIEKILVNNFPLEMEECKKNLNINYTKKFKEINGVKLGLCDLETDGGGWIIIQRRIKGDTNFTKTWKDYKQGFGTVEGDFWIGNDWISKLTMDGYRELRFDMKYNDVGYFAVYSGFTVENEAAKYEMSYASYSGGNIVNDDFSWQKGNKFTTIDSDNDVSQNMNCAVESRGGFWYDSCHRINVNGEWASRVMEKGINWASVTDWTNSLDFVEMKLRRM